ncbi:MAG: hypothetical protein WCL18_06680 [bacterium]
MIIIFLPQLGLPVAIIIPQTIIKTKETIKITVTNILVKLHIKVGKAVVQVTSVSPGPLFAALSSIQFPIKGMEVFNDIPQHTHAALQEVQVPLTFLVPVGQAQKPIAFRFHQEGGLQGTHG